MMKIFIDSADVSEIKQLAEVGIIDGVTTNPTLIKTAFDKIRNSSAKADFDDYVKQILEIVGEERSVSLEVASTDFEGMMKEAVMLNRYNKVAKNVFIKIPINTSVTKEPSFDGLRAIRALSENNIRVNCTLVMSPEQALLAMKAGAKIVSLFCGRVDDFIREKNKIKFKKEEYFPNEGLKKGGKISNDSGIFSGVDLVWRCMQIKKNYGFKSEILAASVRNSRQAKEVALCGADIVTLPYPVIKEMLSHDKTLGGVIKFKEDVVEEYRDLMKKK